MINQKKVTVVMPAYNAEKTLRRTFIEIPTDVVDNVILTDDGSRDQTFGLAKTLGIKAYRHIINRGYGGNQKTCYKRALESGADIIVMLHPDYQYTPHLIVAMASMIAYGVYDAVLGSRILGKSALEGGMPLYKYVSNRFLTLVQNLLMGQKASEYHTGYRAFSKTVLKTLPLEENSDDFVFDNQMLTQLYFFGFRVGEISCPAKYFEDASSINFARSVKYGLGCIKNAILYPLAKQNWYTAKFLSRSGRRLEVPSALQVRRNLPENVPTLKDHPPPTH